MTTKPLNGVRVIDFTTHGAGPAAGKMLADWGADVIKVEGLKGEAGRFTGLVLGLRADDGANPHDELKDANKRAISLNLKTDDGKIIMDRLIADANIFISNFRYQALERLSLDYETMSKKYPHIIYGHLSGFGLEGPDANTPGFDTVAYWARSGTMQDFCEADTPPLTPPFGLGDFATAVSLAGGVAACLYKQSRTGKGEKVMTSLLGQSIWCEASLVQTTACGDVFPKSRKKPVNALRNTYKCADGEWIMLSVVEYDRYYAKVCRALNMESLIGDGRFNTESESMKNASEFVKLLDKVFLTRETEEWISAFEAEDVAVSRVHHIKDILSDKQALANNFIYEFKERDGTDGVGVATPVRFADMNKPVHKNAPLIGENTEEILHELGYTREQIEKLIADKIINTRE